jgi:hypothetical protein
MLAWQCLLVLMRTPIWLRLLGQKIPRPACGSAVAESARRHIVPVIYVGTPGPARKAICHLVDRSGDVVAILKLPLANGAIASIVQEIEILRQMNERIPDILLPRILYLDSERGISAQSAVPGKPSGRRFTSAHAQFLLKLKTGGRANCQQRLSALSARLASIIDPGRRACLERRLERVSLPKGLRAVWQHGDFAPWNIRLHQGQCAAYDWEDGEPDGLPGWDVIHFHVIQAWLFKTKRHPLLQMEANAACRSYRDAMALGDTGWSAVFALYCIEKAVDAFEVGAVHHGDFLLGLIEGRPV